MSINSEMCIELWCIFSTMPELHINGRILYHNSSLEKNAIGASYDTSSSLMFTGRSHNSTIAISTTPNSMDTENSFCGIVFSIFCFCLALVIIISIGMCLIRKRQKNENTRESGIQRVSWNEASIASQFYSNLTLNRHHIMITFLKNWFLFLFLYFSLRQNFVDNSWNVFF